MLEKSLRVGQTVYLPIGFLDGVVTEVDTAKIVAVGDFEKIEGREDLPEKHYDIELVEVVLGDSKWYVGARFEGFTRDCFVFEKPKTQKEAKTNDKDT